MNNPNVFKGAERFSQYTDPTSDATDTPLVSGSFAAARAEEQPSDTGPGPVPSTCAQASSALGGRSAAAVTEDSTSVEDTSGQAALADTIIGGELVRPGDVPSPSPTSSRSAWKNFLALFGVGGPSKAELTEQAVRQQRAEVVIRQQTWTRAVNVAVLAGKGGEGTTPAALLAGGILASIRGGTTCVVEATAAPGALAVRAEGTPRRGLSELLNGAHLIESAGNLAGYTAPQTSHAAVIGTVSYRPQLTPQHVQAARRVLDRYYQLTVSDVDSNLGSPASLAAQRSADAVLIPVTCTALGLTKAVETVQHLTRTAPHLFQTCETPVAVVLGHSGAPEDDEIAASAREVLEKHLASQARVFEAPYEPMFAGSSEFTLAKVLPGTRAAWTEAVANVIARIDDSHTPTFTGGEN